jgi:hypothetical protein
MIIVLLVVFAVAAFLSAFLIQRQWLRWSMTTVMFVGLIGAVVGMVANAHNHFGMVQQTRTTRQEIFTAGDAQQGFGMLLYENIGTDGQSKAYIYRTAADAKKPTVSPNMRQNMTLEETLAAVKISGQHRSIAGDQAFIVTKTTTYVYEDEWAKVLFGIADNHQEIVAIEQTFEVPASWLVLSIQQAKTLADNQAQLAQQMQADPAQAQALARLQQTNPQRAAEVQVEAIKRFLENK